MESNSPTRDKTSLEQLSRELLDNYNELNMNSVDELWEEPSPLEFMRYVARNRPFVIKQGARHWTACKRWSANYLVESIGNSTVNVAITPKGNADAVLESEDGSLLFVKPLEEPERFCDFLAYVQEQEAKSSTGFVKYAQTQNDNLRNEYISLFEDVPTDIPFARIALQQRPDAINFWLGNSRSVTSLHRDNYENIYAQVRGQKHFVLLPPLAAACVNEQHLPAATYARSSNHFDMGEDSTPQAGEEKIDAVTDDPPETVPVAIWDPDEPGSRSTPFSRHAKPIRVTLDEGDLLYLPAMWYHKVSQSCGKEGFCCAVNYWYDMDFSGSFWTVNSYIRDMARLTGR